jgi:hypothetical protein
LTIFLLPAAETEGNQTSNSNNSLNLKPKPKTILGYESGAQVGPSVKKKRGKNFTLLSL